MRGRCVPQSNSDENDRWIESKLTPNPESSDRVVRRFADLALRWATFADALAAVASLTGAGSLVAVRGSGTSSGFSAETTLPPSKRSRRASFVAVLTFITVATGGGGSAALTAAAGEAS